METLSSCETVINRRLTWAERRSRHQERLSASLVENDSSISQDTESSTGHSHDNFQYEEFMSDYVPCPSCGGGGRIDRETESKLVALIPYDDERLKPRRTWLYICVGVAVSVCLAGLILFFLFPRSVKLSSDRKRILPQQAIVIDNTTQPSVFLTIQNEFLVNNSNYVPVTVESLNMSVTAFERVVNKTSNTTLVTIAPRSFELVYAGLDLTFKGLLHATLTRFNVVYHSICFM